MGIYPDYRRVLGIVTLAFLITVGITDVVHARVFHCSAGDVFCLIASIRSANERPGVDTIVLDAGTYTLTTLDNLDDGGNGLPSITSRLTIEGAGPTETIIERHPDSPFFRIVHVATTGDLTLHGLTIRFGVVDFATNGGGILNRGTLTVSRSVVSDNFALGDGGGISNNGTLTVSQSVISDNGVATNAGGILNRGTLTLSQSEMRQNQAFFSGGGAIGNSGTLSIIDSRIVENLAFDAGGIESSSGSLQILRSTVGDNVAEGCGGIASGGTTTIEDSTISGNGSVFLTGGLCLRGTATIMNTTIAANGGGSSIGPGTGGLAASGFVRLINVTVADNRGVSFVEFGVGGGGGISVSTGGGVELQNTILARNTSTDRDGTPGAGFGPDCLGTITSLGNNVIGDTTDCTIDLSSTDHVGDAGLGVFANDSGTTGRGHIPLLPDSPAIDAANRLGCPRRDQLGQRRVDGDGFRGVTCDIGAVEFVP
jgi:hypothetical protein